MIAAVNHARGAADRPGRARAALRGCRQSAMVNWGKAARGASRRQWNPGRVQSLETVVDLGDRLNGHHHTSHHLDRAAAFGRRRLVWARPLVLKRAGRVSLPADVARSGAACDPVDLPTCPRLRPRVTYKPIRPFIFAISPAVFAGLRPGFLPDFLAGFRASFFSAFFFFDFLPCRPSTLSIRMKMHWTEHKRADRYTILRRYTKAAWCRFT